MRSNRIAATTLSLPVMEDRAAERVTGIVALLTAATMVGEILAGWWFNSMALLADGWHMSTHAAAIGLSAVAYAAARCYANDCRFAFGTWKIEVLAGFTSALILLGIAVLMVVGSIQRLADPQPIRFVEAIIVACVGLAVNLLCARILGPAHHHGHTRSAHDDSEGHSHHQPHDHYHHHHHHGPVGEDGRSHHHHHDDLNLRSAYLHVISDAATSALAIVALGGGMLLGWVWLDPVMGIVGAVMVSIWAWSLIKDTCRALLDCEMDHPFVERLRHTLEAHAPWSGKTHTAGLHVWRVGRRRFACIVRLVADDPAVSVQAVKSLLRSHEELAHITVEIERAA
jgi:cation diffusion facilitator family transporter